MAIGRRNEPNAFSKAVQKTRRAALCPCCGRVAKRKKCDACGFTRERWAVDGPAPSTQKMNASEALSASITAGKIIIRRRAAERAAARLAENGYIPGADTDPGLTEREQDTAGYLHDHDHWVRDTRNGITMACRRDDLWLVDAWGPHRTDEEVAGNP